MGVPGATIELKMVLGMDSNIIVCSKICVKFHIELIFIIDSLAKTETVM